MRSSGTNRGRNPDKDTRSSEQLTIKKIKNRLRYREQRYGYKTTNDTYELASHISKHFIHCYWKTKTKRKRDRKFSKRTNRRPQEGGKQLSKKTLRNKTELATPLHISAIVKPFEDGYRLKVHQVFWCCPGPSYNFRFDSSLLSARRGQLSEDF